MVLELDFISTEINGEERPQLVMCMKAAKARDLFEIHHAFISENNLYWRKRGDVCTDEDRSMYGCHGQALMRSKTIDELWTYCIIHMKHLNQNIRVLH
ncbi:hypothetical protein CEXT_101451 [Caerostris extrusa]|uniref:Uncharacterized protein n=1 Tax=Caerostris extrusa TaxID=172846 RepID=A0AAV4TI62_CAEEX|nr:hypothetical protein CEXT_101451 [Caerostris extrusa]